ncbi:MAG: hypothetical protein RR248_03305 [Clostridia bacterium]
MLKDVYASLFAHKKYNIFVLAIYLVCLVLGLIFIKANGEYELYSISYTNITVYIQGGFFPVLFKNLWLYLAIIIVFFVLALYRPLLRFGCVVAWLKAFTTAFAIKSCIASIGLMALPYIVFLFIIQAVVILAIVLYSVNHVYDCRLSCANISALCYKFVLLVLLCLIISIAQTIIVFILIRPFTYF